MGESLNAMMEEVRKTVDETMMPVQRYIYFNLQRSFYECGLNCFNNKKASQNEVQSCLNKCQQPLQRAQMVVDNELNRFQERLERSFMVCRDKVESYDGTPADDQTKLKQMESCMELSLQEHVKVLPRLASNIQAQISENK
ncbi:hypothetical protein R1sor_001833 [Riccia sorocarpa]|uniref:Protein FAM136A n=1 Tax=Riccia sorocarpa TaxID=122646 RepID=A0ABD3GYQ0_9MARC